MADAGRRSGWVVAEILTQNWSFDWKTDLEAARICSPSDANAAGSPRGTV